MKRASRRPSPMCGVDEKSPPIRALAVLRACDTGSTKNPTVAHTPLMKRYPTPGSVLSQRGLAGSSPSFCRSLPTTMRR